jgi:hypothetical protein
VKIAIATPEQALGYAPLQTDFVHPFEIRRRIASLLEEERRTSTEYRFVTMNRTVLDLVRSDGSIGYEDVVVWNGTALAPVLDLHGEDWFSSFGLGDLFDSGDLEPPEE